MASFDSSKLSFEYDALIRARSEKDVQTSLRLANRHRIPVTTRGAGTSLTGSASPVNGGWVGYVSDETDIDTQRKIYGDCPARGRCWRVAEKG